MGLFDIFRKKKEEETVEAAPQVKEEVSTLPKCIFCGSEIHEKPQKFNYGGKVSLLHKRCFRKIRRHPERYASL